MRQLFPMRLGSILLVPVLIASLSGCGRDKKAAGADTTKAAKADSDTTPSELLKPKGEPLAITVPLGLPPLPPAPGPPATSELVHLGRRLFYEGNLGADGVTSCGTCHSYDHDFAETRQFPSGFGGASGERNTPSLLNAVFMTSLHWDGAVQAAAPPLGLLEMQVKFPLEDPTQMATKTDAVGKALNISDKYHLAMQSVFGRTVTVNYMLGARAIAAFERTLIGGNSPFDRYQFGHDDNAISPAALRGWLVFRDPKKGNCVACHTVGENDALFTDGKFHNLGVGLDSTGEGKDLGRFRVTQQNSDRGAFRTPSLRNVAQTAPYMHDGSLRSLRAVVDFYSEGGNVNPYLDPLIKRTSLSEKDREDLVSFLNALTSDMPLNTGRPTVKEDEMDAAADEIKAQRAERTPVPATPPDKPVAKPVPFDKK
jgi:cytochrome c peroxidase